MSSHSKIVWSEGLFLRPQHFQQQSRYFERLVETRAMALRSHSWGCIELELERDLLAIGKIGLKRAAGVLPDGTPFRVPDDEALPEPVDIDGSVRDETVFLAVPVRSDSGAEIDPAGDVGVPVRHEVREFEVRDTATAGGSSALLEVAPLKLRLMLSHDSLDGYAKIPIAQILERRADQKVILDERHLPTVLDVRAAPALATFLAELQGLLHQRGDDLASKVSATGRGGAAEIVDFLMLQTINRYEPLATHLISSGILHPEDLYRLCVSLAGDMATFTTTAKRPPPFPPYRHEYLRESFEPVIASLRSEFIAQREQLAIPIPIDPKKFGYSIALVGDRTLFKTAAFVLAVRADMPAEELRQRFPAQQKIGAAERIRDLVNLQLTGVGLQPVPVAPRQIPYHAGYVYFELDQSGEPWAHMSASSGIGLHVAGEFPGLKMELWAIRG
jgi:type VI secretion system protein ImpJ